MGLCIEKTYNIIDNHWKPWEVVSHLEFEK